MKKKKTGSDLEDVFDLLLKDEEFVNECMKETQAFCDKIWEETKGFHNYTGYDGLGERLEKVVKDLFGDVEYVSLGVNPRMRVGYHVFFDMEDKHTFISLDVRKTKDMGEEDVFNSLVSVLHELKDSKKKYIHK